MKIKKFIKKNYKRLIIQFISVVSALVIFCIPASASTTITRIDTTNLWCTNFSIRSGDFSNDNWGTVVQTLHGQNLPYYPPYGDITNSDTHTGRVVRYVDEENSVELQGKYIVTTWQLYDDSIEIRAGHVYVLNIPFVFVMNTNKTIVTDFIKVSLWDRNNASTPYYNAISNERLTWKPVSQDGYYELMYTITLKNYSEVSIIPNYIRIAIKIDNTLKFWRDNEFGFSNFLTVEDMGDVSLYPTVDNSSLMIYGSAEKEIVNSTEGGRDNVSNILNQKPNVNFTNGIKAASNLLTKFIDLNSMGGIIQFSLTVGMCAFLLGLAPSMLRGIGGKKNNNKKGGGS